MIRAEEDLKQEMQDALLQLKLEHRCCGGVWMGLSILMILMPVFYPMLGLAIRLTLDISFGTAGVNKLGPWMGVMVMLACLPMILVLARSCFMVTTLQPGEQEEYRYWRITLRFLTTIYWSVGAAGCLMLLFTTLIGLMLDDTSMRWVGDVIPLAGFLLIACAGLLFFGTPILGFLFLIHLIVLWTKLSVKLKWSGWMAWTIRGLVVAWLILIMAVVLVGARSMDRGAELIGRVIVASAVLLTMLFIYFFAFAIAWEAFRRWRSYEDQVASLGMKEAEGLELKDGQ